MDEVYFIPQELLQKIESYLQENLPEEGCGLLGGQDHTFQSWIPVPNVLRSPTRYRMEPEAQLKAFLYFEENQQDLLGIVHSHPTGPDKPSQTDLKEAYYPEAVYFIFYRTNEQWQYKAYRINQNHYIPVEIHTLK
ncbi:MAG: Mov34/MPN/PAD-1 family protein [Anaerolineae bacterium]|jgi:proteasome lid subunit RPN8/RPN11|nr:MAG: Mov34/MPN/PAD-1 family protein [Anaerolineae bacterium]